MNDLQTMQSAIGCSVALMFGILGMVILELFRKLSKERELTERLRRMNSNNYHHRRTMERAIVEYCSGDIYSVQQTEAAWNAMTMAAAESEVDRD